MIAVKGVAWWNCNRKKISGMKWLNKVSFRVLHVFSMKCFSQLFFFCYFFQLGKLPQASNRGLTESTDSPLDLFTKSMKIFVICSKKDK